MTSKGVVALLAARYSGEQLHSRLTAARAPQQAKRGERSLAKIANARKEAGARSSVPRIPPPDQPNRLATALSVCLYLVASSAAVTDNDIDALLKLEIDKVPKAIRLIPAVREALARWSQSAADAQGESQQDQGGGAPEEKEEEQSRGEEELLGSDSEDDEGASDGALEEE